MSLPIKVISTDFDGTVHSEFEHPPIPRVLEKVLAEAQTRGAVWVINTGRDLPGLLATLEQANIAIRPDYVAVVEREIYQLREREYIAVEDWNDACSRDHEQLFARIRQDVPELAKWVQKKFKAQVYEDSYSPFCLIAESVPDADAIQERLEEYCATVPHLTVVRNHIYARFSHVAYNKGKALGEIARRLKARPEEVLAAGDHYNDLPMLSREFAHALVAPANSIPEVKELVLEQGGHVSEKLWGHGVAEGIIRYIRAV